jgi:hypothetical protein
MSAASCGTGFSQTISRAEALKLVQAALKHDNVVSQVRVSGRPAVDVLVQKGHVGLTDARCELPEWAPCKNVVLSNAGDSLFTAATGEYYGGLVGGSNKAVLILRTGLLPTDVTVTGIRPLGANESVVVEFTFTYQVPALLADLPPWQEVSPDQMVPAVKLELSGGIHVGSAPPYAGVVGRRWKGWRQLLRYDDGWRVGDYQKVELIENENAAAGGAPTSQPRAPLKDVPSPINAAPSVAPNSADAAILEFTKEDPYSSDFPAHRRDVSSGFDAVWNRVIELLTASKDKIVTSDKEKGLVVTAITRHGSLVANRQKYCVVVAKVAEGATRVTLKLMMYERDTSKTTAVWIPSTAEVVHKTALGFLEQLGK